MAIRQGGLPVLLVAVVTAVISLQGDADAGACNATWLRVDPGEAFARNGALLVEATSSLRGPFAAAVARARLVAPGLSVPLHARRRIEGTDEGPLQIVLTPATTLPAGTTFRLLFGDKELDRFLDHDLTTSTSTLEAAPTWSGPPHTGKRTKVAEKGERHDVYAIRVPVDGASHILATIESKDGVAGADIVDIRAGSIEIGTKTCFGQGTKLPGKGPWRVTLTAIGAGGRETPAPGAPLVLAFP